MEKTSASDNLRAEMPDTEAELFAMEQYPLFDINVAIEHLGDIKTSRYIMQHLKDDGINPDLPALKIAHEQQDWEQIEKLAHKMKSGAVYGTPRLYYALLFMERYRQAGYLNCSEQLYQQMLKVIDETIAYLQDWLTRQP